MSRFWNLITMSCVAFVMAVSLLHATPAQAQDGRIHLKITKTSFLVGIGGGRGTLYYQGKSYPLSVGGLKAGLTIGVATVELVGNAYNLTRVSDIEGTYNAASGSAALIAGAASVILQNSRGVKLKVSGKQIGLELSLDIGGMTIRLK